MSRIYSMLLLFHLITENKRNIYEKKKKCKREKLLRNYRKKKIYRFAFYFEILISRKRIP